MYNKYFILLISLISASGIAFGQDIKPATSPNEGKNVVESRIDGDKKTTIYSDGSRTISVRKKQPSVVSRSTKTSKTSQNKVIKDKSYYDRQIESIRKKIEWVKSNPTEHKKALENGWYDEMNERINQLNKQIKKLNK